MKETDVERDAQIQKLKELVMTQCSDGNWNYDKYMHGMANGMILALALMENKEPVFLDAPEKYLSEKTKDFYE